MPKQILKTFFFLTVFFLIFPNKSVAGKVLQKSDFTYIGAFRVPKGIHGESSFANIGGLNAQYQPMAYNPYNNSIFLGQSTGVETNPKRLGEISIPAIINPLYVGMDVTQLNTATVIQNIADPSGGTFDNLKTGGIPPSDEAKAQLGGLYVYDNKLFGTAWSYYDASGSNGDRSHWTANLDWSSGYGFSGLHTVGISPTGSASGGFVGGYMVEVPDEYKSALGYPLLTGRVGGPIVGRSSIGPSIWGFDPDDLDYDNPADAQVFISYIEGVHEKLGGYNLGPSLMWNMASGNKGIIWPSGSDSILVFGSHGLGIEYDAGGYPLTNTAPECLGPGTSNRGEAKTNEWLLANFVSAWDCGYTEMSAADISGGDSCCFDPSNPSDTTHSTGYIIANGNACYGEGTVNYSESRTNLWLRANSPSGYLCGSLNISEAAIIAGSGCCFVGTGEVSKGGSSYPGVYQVWQYEVADLLAVKTGIKNYWEPIPTIWNFDLPLDNPNEKKQIIGVAYDESTKRLYVGQAFGDGLYPLIHVFQVNIDGTGDIIAPVAPSGLNVL